MFITIADFWLSGWDDVQPVIPDIPGTATISSVLAFDATTATVAVGTRTVQGVLATDADADSEIASTATVTP